MKTDIQASAKKTVFGLAAAMAAVIGMPQQANAFVVPVYDMAVHTSTAATAVTVAAGIILDQHRNDSSDSYYLNTENHFSNIDTNITNIDTNIENIDTTITTIDTRIKNHFDYTANISIINNNYYGSDDGLEPIPWQMVANEDAGPMEDYLTEFKDAAAYKDEACFGGKCEKGDLDTLLAARAYGVEAQKKSNDAMLKTLEFQRGDLVGEGQRLAHLGQKVLDDPEETGQRKQMQLALLLASEQGNHLLKMREAMLQSQSAEVVREQVANDTRAKQVASAQGLRRTVSFEPGMPTPTSY